MFFLAACAPAAALATPTLSPAFDNGTIAVYFSNPDSFDSAVQRGGPDEALQAAIEGAELTIDMAIYDLNLYNIRDALIASSQRGVQVRLVIESDNLTAEEIQLLTTAGITLVGDEDPDSMHDKFTIIDRYEVWTGSMNYTLTDAYGNRNNVVRVRSAVLAANYLAEFEEMFTQGLFGGSSPADTPNPDLVLAGTRVETFFSPEDRAQTRLVELIDSAEDSIYILAYSFTSDPLAEALLAAQARGVEILGVFDNTQAANQGGEFGRLTASDIDVRIDGEGGSMHNKVLIIDGAIVVTGSYNFSANAEHSNDENMLIIHNADLAAQYLAEFWRIWELAE